MKKRHRYAVTVRWTGNTGTGTSSYRAYSRDHEIRAGRKPAIAGSADPAFRGDPDRWNPEDLLLASLSACHKLWYGGLCAEAGIVVTAYEDDTHGTMIEQPDGAGQFEAVVLHPRVTIARAEDAVMALDLHHRAHALCFIARSVAFPVGADPTIVHGAGGR